MYRLLLLLAMLLCSLSVNANNYDVLLDVSGSMLGFQKDGLHGKQLSRSCSGSEKEKYIGSGWKSFLDNINDNAKKTCAFGDKYRCFKEVPLHQLCLGDQNTDLAGALQSWLNQKTSGKNLLILTDNVADTSNANSLKNQNKFKELLSGSSSQFTHIAIITLRLPFKGNVYTLDNKKKKYEGKRALVAYVLSKGNSTDKSFKAFRETIKTKLANYDSMLFQIRPFETDSVKQKFGKITMDADEKNEVAIKRIKLKNGRTAIKISNYNLGSPLDFSFDTDLEIQGAFKLNGIKLEADIRFDELPQHLTSRAKGQSNDNVKFKATVSPSEVTLTPKKVQGFKISFEMDRFTFGEIPFKQKLKYALSNTQELTGTLDLLFNIKREQYEADNTLFNEWTHGDSSQLGEASESIQSRVYNLESILSSGVAESTSEENLKSFPLILEVRYTMGPILSAIALAIVVLGLLYWMWLKSRGSQDYIIENDMGEQTTLSIGLGQSYQHYDDRNRHLFSLRFLGFAYFVTSRYKLEGSRLLSSGQSFELFDNETDNYEQFYLRKLDDNTSSFDNDSYDDDSNW